MAYCELDRVDSILTFNTDQTPTGELRAINDTDLDLYLPRPINKDVFKNIFEAYNKLSDIERNTISRAIAWFRISMIKKNQIFEFISLWIALETICQILNDKVKKKKSNSSKYRGLIKIFNDKIKNVSFNDIRESRVHLFHSLGDISQNYRIKIESCLDPMRKSFIYGAGVCS